MLKMIRRSAIKGHLEIVQLLIEKGANIHANNDCAENGNLEIVNLLQSLSSKN